MERISVQNTQLVPEIVLDYIQQKQELKPFYNFANQENNYEILKQQRRNFSHIQRQKLHTHLSQQYKQIGIDLAQKNNQFVQANIQSLLNEQVYTVCTGHQLVLFGGPLFTTYKILTTIKLAKELSKNNPLTPVVPVFWLATEDHDFDEIKSVQINDKELELKLAHDSNPVGSLLLNEVESLIEDLVKNLPSNAYVESFVKAVKKSYQNGFTLSAASIHFYHELYAEFGLVILDADAKLLKETLVPVIKNDLVSQLHFTAQKETDAVLATKYHLQINARPFNFFYINEERKRFLIQKGINQQFQLTASGQMCSQEELIQLIENYPERFSPNVNLRPLYQELILPNLAYVGGPSEIAYWLQLKAIFNLYEQAFPILVLRHMQVFVPNSFAQSLNKFGLTLAQILLPEAQLEQAFFSTSSYPDIDAQIKAIDQNWQFIYDSFLKINDPAAKAALIQKLADRQASKELQKLYKALRKDKLQVQFQKVKKLREELFPGGAFQERKVLLISIEAVRLQSLQKQILSQIQVFEPNLLFFTL